MGDTGPRAAAERPLSPAAAKARLLAAAEAADPGTWVRRHPWGTAGGALLLGLLLARLPRARLAALLARPQTVGLLAQGLRLLLRPRS